MTSLSSHTGRADIASPVIVALDYDNPDDALAFADRIDPAQCRLKVGKELFTFCG